VNDAEELPLAEPLDADGHASGSGEPETVSSMSETADSPLSAVAKSPLQATLADTLAAENEAAQAEALPVSPNAGSFTAESAEDEESPVAAVWQPDPDKLLCAVLFATQEFLTARALRDIMGDEWDLGSLRRLVKSVNQRFAAGDMPFEVVEVEATFRLRTQTRYFPWVKKLFKEATPRRLSQAGLETLAIIAYKQPITKAEVEAIRGVNVDGALKSLLEKKLIDIHRRSEAIGGAFTYVTTREFLRYFGISKVPDDLPRLSEFEQIVNSQALIPQIGPQGDVRHFDQPEGDGEQMSLGVES
jgi:segregation and condensation protein B